MKSSQLIVYYHIKNWMPFTTRWHFCNIKASIYEVKYRNQFGQYYKVNNSDNVSKRTKLYFGYESLLKMKKTWVRQW